MWEALAFLFLGSLGQLHEVRAGIDWLQQVVCEFMVCLVGVCVVVLRLHLHVLHSCVSVCA